MKKRASISTPLLRFVVILCAILLPVLVVDIVISAVLGPRFPDLKNFLILVREAIGFSYIMAVINSLEFFNENA